MLCSKRTGTAQICLTCKKSDSDLREIDCIDLRSQSLCISFTLKETSEDINKRGGLE